MTEDTLKKRMEERLKRLIFLKDKLDKLLFEWDRTDINAKQLLEEQGIIIGKKD